MSLQTIDAGCLAKMFLAGAKNLESKKEWINELNVFPVPDGDTGTNMTLTIMSAAKEVAAMENVLILTGNKLALVIPGAIIQQKFYMPGKNNTAMSINGMMQLILYIREATRHFLCLTPRKMQRFFLAIMEKGIIFNMILQ